MIGIGLIFLFDGPGIFGYTGHINFCCSSKNFKIEPYFEKLAKKKKKRFIEQLITHLFKKNVIFHRNDVLGGVGQQFI